MKKWLFAPLALSALASTVHAQSSMTLYGIVDAGIAYVNNQATGPKFAKGSKNFFTSAGNMQGDRWGLRGEEDLGGGMRAILVLENGFNVYNGTLSQGGREFGRQAFVGLGSASAGTVTVGRQYDSGPEYVGVLSSPIWATIVGAHPLDNDNLVNTFRINNSVKYTTPVIGGFNAGAVYGFSNQANTGAGSGFAYNRAWSVGAGYARGPLKLGVSALHVNNPNSANNPNGAVGTDFPSFATLGPAANHPVDRQQVYAAGGSYAIGPGTIGLVYSHTRFDFMANAGRLQFDNIEANATWMVTPAFRLGAAYIYTSGKLSSAPPAGDTKPKFHQVNLGVDYWLSKRSDLYLVGLYQRAAGDQQNASLYTFGTSSTKNQVAIIAGIRHKF
jgi:predicted porin